MTNATLLKSLLLMFFLRFYYMNMIVNTGFNTTLIRQSEMICTLIQIQMTVFLAAR